MGVGGLTVEMFYTADGLDSAVQVPDLSALARDTITSDAVQIGLEVNHDDDLEPWTMGGARSNYFAARWSGRLYIHDAG
eukprot:4324284-Amphidinium_carterae.1